MLGPLPKLPRMWSDVVRDLAREPNTLRMAELIKELTEVNPKMFSNASRERRRRQNEMGLHPGFGSPSQSTTVEDKRRKLDQE